MLTKKNAPINERQKMNVKYLGPKLKLEKLVKHKSTVEGGGGRLKFNFGQYFEETHLKISSIIFFG